MSENLCPGCRGSATTGSAPSTAFHTLRIPTGAPDRGWSGWAPDRPNAGRKHPASRTCPGQRTWTSPAGFHRAPRRADVAPRDCSRRHPRRSAGYCSSCDSRRATPCRYCRSSSCRTVPVPSSLPGDNRPGSTDCGTRSSPAPCRRTQPRSATRTPSSLWPSPPEGASRDDEIAVQLQSWHGRRYRVGLWE